MTPIPIKHQPKKRHKKDLTLAKMRKTQERIQVLQRLPALREVLKPKDRIFAGHWRFFVVRADILRGSQGEILNKIVQATNHWVLGNKKEHKSYQAHTWAWQDGTMRKYVAEQRLFPLSQEEFNAKGFNTAKYLKYFRIEEKIIKVGSSVLVEKVYFPKLPPHALEFDYKKAYIVELTHPNPDVESELAHLQQFMYDNNGYARLYGNGKDHDGYLERKEKLTRGKQSERREIANQLEA